MEGLLTIFPPVLLIIIALAFVYVIWEVLFSDGTSLNYFQKRNIKRIKTDPEYRKKLMKQHGLDDD